MPETLEEKDFLICPVRNATEQDKEATQNYISTNEAKGRKFHYPPRDTPQDDPIGLNICRTNRQAILGSKKVHVYWTPGSEGTKFDLGMSFMAGNPLKFVNARAYIMAPQDSFESFLLELDLARFRSYPILRQACDNSIYIVAPSRGLNDADRSLLEKFVSKREASDRKWYYPTRDAPKGLVGMDYFIERRNAMQRASEFRVFWAGSNIDNYFELGMAFMEEKSGKPSA
jgi:hypothetical protein